MADLFISYSRRDSDFVRDLHTALDARGADVWVDWEDIPPAWDWKEELRDGIERAQVLVFVISPDSLRSEVCRNELEQALAHGKRVVPLVRREPNGEAVPPSLADRNWIFFREEDDFDAGVARLVSAVETDQGWVREHTRLLTRATEWDRADRSGALLLRGSDLTNAERALAGWREGTEPAPTALQQEYVAAGRRGSARRTRALLAASAVALAISVVLGILALIERNKAIEREQSAQSRSLAVEALLRAESDPDLSVALALEAVGLDRTEQAEEALRRSVSQLQARGVLKVSKEEMADVSVRSDAQVLAVASDGVARVWDPRNGRSRELEVPDGELAGAQLDNRGRRVLLATRSGGVVQDLRGDRSVALRSPALYAASFTDDGKTVYGLEGGSGVARFDAATGRRLRPRLDSRGGDLVQLSSDRIGRFMVGVHQDGLLRTWDTRTGGHRDVRGKDVLALAVSPDGGFAARVEVGALAVKVWSPTTGKALPALKGHERPPVAVDVSSDGRLIATGAQDNTARIWDARTGREETVLRGHGDTVSQVAFSRDGRRLLTVSNDETARVWSVETGEALAVLRGHRGEIATADLTFDGRFVATGGADGTARLWEASPGRTLAALPHRGSIEAATLDPKGEVVASSGPDRIQFADARTGAILAQDDADILSSDPTADIAFDGKRRYMAVADGPAAFVFDVGSGDFGYLGQGAAVTSVAWTRDGRHVITAAADGVARVIDPANADKAELEIHAGGTLARALPTPDGRRIVTLDAEGAAKVFDAATGARRAGVRLPSGAMGMELSPDGRTVAIALRDRQAVLWRPDEGDQLRRLEHREYVSAVRFSRDGRRVATASGDGTARVWDAAGGRLLHTLRGHLQPVVDADFSPDGRFLLTASEDRRALLFDLTTGRVVGVFGGHDGDLLRARFSSDGRKVLTVPTRGAAAVFACDACEPLDELVERARRLVPRRLSERERSRYLD